MDDSLIGLVALNLAESVSYDAYQALIEQYGSVRKALAATRRELAAVPGIGPKTARRLRELSNGDEAIEEIEQARDIELDVVTCEDDDVEEAPDPPRLDWVAGKDDGVNPDSGPPGTIFGFTVVYTSPEDKPPTINELRIDFSSNGVFEGAAVGLVSLPAGPGGDWIPAALALLGLALLALLVLPRRGLVPSAAAGMMATYYLANHPTDAEGGLVMEAGEILVAFEQFYGVKVPDALPQPAPSAYDGFA